MSENDKGQKNPGPLVEDTDHAGTTDDKWRERIVPKREDGTVAEGDGQATDPRERPSKSE